MFRGIPTPLRDDTSSTSLCRTSPTPALGASYNRLSHARGRKPSYYPWIVTIAVMLATFMEVLDTTVVNVAIPHLSGNMGATVEEGTWVVTSYLVSNAIVLPMSGWLANRFGRRRILMF